MCVCSRVEYSYKINFWCFRALFVHGAAQPLPIYEAVRYQEMGESILVRGEMCLRSQVDICEVSVSDCERYLKCGSITSPTPNRKLHLNLTWIDLFNMSFSATAMLISSDSWCSACLMTTLVALCSYLSWFFLELCTVCFTSPRCLRALKGNYCQMML